VTRILAEKIFPGTIVGLDFSPERLASGIRIKNEEEKDNISFVCGDLLSPGLKGKQFDMAYSRCTFQYLPGQRGIKALQSMKHLVRPGGRVAVADIDGVSLYRWPLDPIREEALDLLLRKLEPVGFDAFIGRKLYGMFLEVGFKDIRVDLLPYYLIAGPADPTTTRVWEMKFEILKDHIESTFGSTKKVKDLIDRFMADFRRKDVLLYNFLFIVQGIC
jgi:ubiquinone/menaquinone biosynthesis C-methylase UbiE